MEQLLAGRTSLRKPCGGTLPHRRSLVLTRPYLVVGAVCAVQFFSLCPLPKADVGEEGSYWDAYDIQSLSTNHIPWVTLPLTYTVPEDSRLLLYGVRIITATLAADVKGRLTLNARPILPAPPPPERVWTDDELRKLYPEVPLVQRLVAAGTSWSDAVKLFSKARRALSLTARRACSEAYAVTANWGEAVAAAAEAVARVDSLDLLSEPISAAGPNTLLLCFRGTSCLRVIGANEPTWVPRDSIPQTESCTPPTEEAVREAATSIYFWTSGMAGHPFLFSLAPDLTQLGGPRAQQVILQIDRILAGESIEEVAATTTGWSASQLVTLFPSRGRR